MPLPFYFHVGNSGGLSFVRAIRTTNDADDILIINNETDLALALPRLTAGTAARLTLAFGHAIHLAEPWIPDRYEITMIRWPLAAFCANMIYVHENPANSSSLPEVFEIADHHERLRAYLDHLERGGGNHLGHLVQWLDERHKLGCDPWPGRTERRSTVEPCDALFRDFYQLVAITELMDESLFLYQADFPDRKVAPWVRKRENNQRIDAFNLPPDIVARFEREYDADITLYNRARQRLLARFSALLQARPEMREHYLAYKTAMILTDAVLMARFAQGDPLYFPPELPLEELRASVVSQLDRAHDIRAKIMRAYG